VRFLPALGILLFARAACAGEPAYPFRRHRGRWRDRGRRHGPASTPHARDHRAITWADLEAGALRDQHALAQRPCRRQCHLWRCVPGCAVRRARLHGEAMDVDTIIPGCGPVVHDKAYLTRIAELMASIDGQVTASWRPGISLDELRKHVDLASFRVRIAGESAFVGADARARRAAARL